MFIVQNVINLHIFLMALQFNSKFTFVSINCIEKKIRKYLKIKQMQTCLKGKQNSCTIKKNTYIL